MLSDQLEPTLRELGERGDIIKAINRALSARGQERDLSSYVLHAEKPSAPVVGRVIEKRLADELGDRISLVIDALDGRVHHVMLADAAGTEHVNLGTIVEVVRSLAQRPADRTIAELRAARRNIGRAFTEILPRRRADPFPVEITMATSALMSPLGSTPPGRDC